MTPSAAPFTPLTAVPAGSSSGAMLSRLPFAGGRRLPIVAVAVAGVLTTGGASGSALRTLAAPPGPVVSPTSSTPVTTLPTVSSGSLAAAGSLVVITRPGRDADVATAVRAHGGTVVRDLAGLDTLVVSGVTATALNGDPAVLSVSNNASMSGRSAGWGDADVSGGGGTGSETGSTDLRGFGSTPDPAAAVPAPAQTTPSPVIGGGSGSGSGDGSGDGSGGPTSTAPTTPTPSSVSLSSAEDSIRARSAWAASTGRGVDVALIDTGIAPVAGLSGAGKVVNGPDLSFESVAPERRYVDNNGHGTHMAGIIAGNDLNTGAGPAALWLAGLSGKVAGVAPGARLVNVKVGDGNGVTDVSQVLAAIDWVVQHAHDPQGPDGGGLNIRVLNLSFGTDSSQPAAIDPLAHAAEVAWRNGIVVVTSAGNAGTTLGRLTDPAMDPYVIAVGADDTAGTRSSSDDTVADFSSRGDGVRNPDVVAPGVHIASLRQPGGVIDQAFGGAGSGDPRFIRGSGTSQAAAVVSGAAALLLSARPGLSADQVKALLVGTAHGLSNSNPSASGAGLIDVSKALTAGAPNASQNFPVSTGTGSLDASRGSSHPALDGVSLTGEQDIFGQPYDSAAMAAAREQEAAWTGGVWNGSSWAGSSWAGSSWAGSSWAGSSWAGSSWAGSSWAGSSWAGSSWAGSSWAGSSWAGSSWAGSAWADASWN